jgi:ADP-ribose pyrophosphatase YjhB (NUDIX family)
MGTTAESNRVAALILLRSDGAALLQHRDDKPGLRHAGMWTPPGGHCNPGEPPEHCARREFLEETAYKCAELRWLTSVLDDHERLDVFWGCYDGVSPLTCLEGQALRFVPRQEVGAYPIPEYLVAIWDLALRAMEQHPLTTPTIGPNH